MDKSTFTQPEEIKKQERQEWERACQGKEGSELVECVDRLPDPPPAHSSATTQDEEIVILDPAVAAARHSAGRRKFTAGSVLLPVGMALAILAAVPLVRAQDQFGKYTDMKLTAVGGAMGCLGLGLIAAGAALLTLGNRELSRPRRVAMLPYLNGSTNSAAIGLSGAF